MPRKADHSPFRATDSKSTSTINIDGFVTYISRGPSHFHEEFEEFKNTSEQLSPPPTPPPGPLPTVKQRIIFEDDHEVIPVGFEIFYRMCVMRRRPEQSDEDRKRDPRYYPRVFAGYREYDYDSPKSAVAEVHDIPDDLDKAALEDAKKWRAKSRNVRPFDFEIFLVRHVIVSWEDYLSDIDPANVVRRHERFEREEQAAAAAATERGKANEEILSSSQETLKPPPRDKGKGKERAVSPPDSARPKMITSDDYLTAAKHLRYLERFVATLQQTYKRLHLRESKLDKANNSVRKMMDRQHESVTDLIQQVETWIKEMPKQFQDVFDDMLNLNADLVLGDDDGGG